MIAYTMTDNTYCERPWKGQERPANVRSNVGPFKVKLQMSSNFVLFFCRNIVLIIPNKTTKFQEIWSSRLVVTAVSMVTFLSISHNGKSQNVKYLENRSSYSKNKDSFELSPLCIPKYRCKYVPNPSINPYKVRNCFKILHYFMSDMVHFSDVIFIVVHFSTARCQQRFKMALIYEIKISLLCSLTYV